MPEPFFQRLREYYLDVAAVLRGEAKASSIFPNATDKGMARETVYADFLRQHAPSKCNVFFGGFLFGQDGSESTQMDVIITTDTTPQFLLKGPKSFSPVDGTLGVASIKSTLDKKELHEALQGIASIPKTSTSTSPILTFGDRPRTFDDWPLKILYASDGIAANTLMVHLLAFYADHPEIPLCRRPDIIHVAGKYAIIRAQPGTTRVWNSDKRQLTAVPEGTFHTFTKDSDLQAILVCLMWLQQNATASTHTHYNYDFLVNRVNNISDEYLTPPEAV